MDTINWMITATEHFLLNLCRIALAGMIFRSAVGLLRASRAYVKGTAVTRWCGAQTMIEQFFLLTLMAWNLKPFWPGGYQKYLLEAGLALIICVSCTILEKVLQQRSIRRMLDQAIDRFLEVTGRWEMWFETAGKFFCAHKFLMALFSMLLLGIGLWIPQVHASLEGSLAATVCMFLAYCVYLSYALHSCRRLFLLLFAFAWSYTLQVQATLKMLLAQAKSAGEGASELIVIVVVYTALWLFTAIVAEDEPVQMVFKIVNTFTTIVALLGNILISVLLTESHIDEIMVSGYSNEAVLKIAFNISILPLVVAGYLAQLIKDFQILIKRNENVCRE